jgi:hypothetical protein
VLTESWAPEQQPKKCDNRYPESRNYKKSPAVFDALWRYWGWFATAYIRPYHDEITAISTFIIGVFTVVLAIIARRQIKDTRILQRAYVTVEPLGIAPFLPPDDSEIIEPRLVGHVGIRNAGRLPARNVRWFINMEFDPNPNRREFPIGKYDGGKNIIAPNGTMRQGSPNIERVGGGGHIFVWGEVLYEDGFEKWHSTTFCHRYNCRRLLPNKNGIERIHPRYGRQHDHGNDAS